MTATIAPERGALTPEETARYGRHLILPEVGLAGQTRLKQAHVLLVGAGGLGSPLALYLAAAGVGHLGMVDFDRVDLSNLQRQILHGTSDVGRSKLESARRRITDINPHVRLTSYETRLTAANALEIIRGYDLVVDGTDNFAARFLVNDACVLLGVPNVYGSIFRFEGQASVFATAEGPCYRCLFRSPPPEGLAPSCAEGGVLGVLPGLVGVIQATEAIKLLLGIGEPLVGRLLLIDALTMEFKTVRVRKDPRCPACGTREIRELRDEVPACGTAGSEDAVPEIEPRTLAQRLARGDDVVLVDVREPHEWAICRLEGAVLIPIGSLVEAEETLPRDRELVIYCKGGVRGTRAVRQLRAAGFNRIHNLAGGILRWSDEVDSAVPRY
jgi:sulfur-carrier protein adenylyltransferase/sulfurtransferase